MTAPEPTLNAASGAGLADADVEEPATPSSVSLLNSRIERLQDLEGSALREEWRRLFRSEPPRISRDLLARALAYRLQELEFGGLPKWARQTVDFHQNLSQIRSSFSLYHDPSVRLLGGASFFRADQIADFADICRETGSNM